MNDLIEKTQFIFFGLLLKLPRKHLVAIVVSTFMLAWLISFESSHEHLVADKQIDVDAVITAKPNLIASKVSDLAKQGETASFKVSSEPEYQHAEVVISVGDTLSAIFERLNIPQQTLYEILSADESLLALETLKPNNVLIFKYLTKNHELQELELFVHAGHRVIYRRAEDGGIEYETVIQDGEWRTRLVSGEVNGSFYLSAQKAGLTEADAAVVTNIFKEQINFTRALRRGDKFQIIKNEQFVDGNPTGQAHIVSARFQQKTHEYTAFLFNDGRFYDKQGHSLTRAFRRLPLQKSYRVSSHFNPRRKHPVTGRIRPHNGIDFATPIGTKVISTGDGVVTRIGNHKFAGKYIDIKHSSRYKTRYLHLHKINVHKGQSIKRGQIIALSGNTGRSTGPHLHFELHMNGRPVDPLKAKIPLTRSLTKSDKAAFLKLVSMRTNMLDSLLDPEINKAHETILAD